MVEVVAAMSTRREVVRVKGEVLEPYPRVDVPVPGELEAWAHPIGPTVIYVPQPAPVAPEPQKPSRAVPWALITVAACILVYACFAAWHTWVGPQLDPVRKHPVDLVGPHR